MKLKRIITGSLLALTMAFGVGVGVGVNRKAEVKEAKAVSYTASVIVQKDDNDAKWDGCYVAAYIFDGNSHTAWGDKIANNSNTYQEYSWTVSFDPTTIILLRVPSNWSSSWDNPWWDGSGGIYARTGNITLSSSSVVWMKGNAKEGSNWGTFTPDAVVKGGASDSWSQATVDTALTHVKVNGSNNLEIYGSATLQANTYFKIVKEGSTWCGNYSAHSSIQSNLSGGGSNNIHNTAAATYEFYFDWVTLSTYITDPVEAAADEWAQAFLANVGCDETGASVPSGWSGEVTRYNAITDGDVKDRIYSATAKEDGTYVQQAVARYDVAVRNHPNLTKFIKDSHNNTRSSAVIVNPISKTISDKNTATSIIVVAVVSLTAIAATGFFFFFYKKKNQ